MKLLLVDDEPAVLFTLEEVFAAKGHETLSAPSVEAALGLLDESVDVVITDLTMPGPADTSSGLALLKAVQARDAELPVILLTAHGSERAAVQAMKGGAWDYLAKPFAVEELLVVAERAAEARSLRREARTLRIERVTGGPIVGRSPKFVALLEQARRVAPRDVTVLLRGETGTGKELVAALLHAESPRNKGPFVRFNCGAISPELGEAELFGHARGAFTGAVASRRGFFQEADGGTLVLDEIGELAPALQSKLLRALQSGEVQPVGASKVEKVDVRVVACTHRDLLAAARAGTFREDLYFRLAVVELVLPPLRERIEDVPLLVEAFRQKWSRRFGLSDVTLSGSLVAALAARPWPGNVRELENAIARLLALSTGGLLDETVLERLEPASAPGATGLREQVAAFERAILQRTLEAAGWNQSEAARRLGITRVTLIDKMKRYELRRG